MMYQQNAPQYGYGYGQNAFMGNGMVPNAQAQMPKTGNWLSAEDYALLQKGLSQFNLSVTKEELAKGQCNHYNNLGFSALVPDADGSGGCTCAICGTHFTSKEFSQEDVANATQNILDILNTIKIMYLSMDPNAALEYFQIIPFIEKIPQLYQIAVADFKKYEGVSSFTQPQVANPFNVFSMMTNPGFGMYQQPMAQPMGQPMGAPQPMYGAPQMNAGFAQQNPAFNPMYAQQAAPAPGYAPQANGYAFNPQGAAAGYVNPNMPTGNVPQQQPAATTAAPTEEVKVDTQFKK